MDLPPIDEERREHLRRLDDAVARDAAAHARVARQLTRSTRRNIVLMVGALASAGAVFVGSFAFFLTNQQDRQVSTGQTSLENCQQIEGLKLQLRAILRQSLARLPSTEYYRERPAELESAVASTRESIARFAPKDCYRLPAVEAAGLRP